MRLKPDMRIVMGSAIFLFILASRCLGQLYVIDSLESTMDNTFKVRENFKSIEDNKLDIIEAENTYITLSSASATYANAADYLSKSSATATYANQADYLTKSSATATYANALDYLSKSSATATYANALDYLSKSSATATYVQKTDIGSIYMVILTTNTGGSEGDQTIIAHGVTFSKIVGWTAVLFLDSSNGRAPNVSGYGINYRVSAGTTYMSINLHDTDSENILNKQVKITVLYTQ